MPRTQADRDEDLNVGRQIERDIGNAVAAERERCAKIADQFARANENLNDGTDAPGAIAAARAIAAEIRKE